MVIQILQTSTNSSRRNLGGLPFITSDATERKTTNALHVKPNHNNKHAMWSLRVGAGCTAPRRDTQTLVQRGNHVGARIARSRRPTSGFESRHSVDRRRQPTVVNGTIVNGSMHSQCIMIIPKLLNIMFELISEKNVRAGRTRFKEANSIRMSRKNRWKCTKKTYLSSSSQDWARSFIVNTRIAIHSSTASHLVTAPSHTYNFRSSSCHLPPINSCPPLHTSYSNSQTSSFASSELVLKIFKRLREIYHATPTSKQSQI